MNFSDLFPDEDHQLQMRFERGAIADFFAPGDSHVEIMAQRRHWLKSEPHTYAALKPAAVPLLEEAMEVTGNNPKLLAACADAASDWERCLGAGQFWEPDFLLLKLAADGQFRLVGGCVCFPSAWSLADKIGRPMEFIHGVVPGLNAQLGTHIHRFMSRIRPGLAWLRTNWGLSRSPELNQHPSRKIPRLDDTACLEEVWLRIERQALVALPQSEGILFGIRIQNHSLTAIKAVPAAAQGLARALRTMDEDLARYKGLATARSAIISLLEN